MTYTLCAFHNPELLDKKRILAISKMDLATPDDIKKLKKLKLDIPLLKISAATGLGVVELKDQLWKELHEE